MAAVAQAGILKKLAGKIVGDDCESKQYVKTIFSFIKLTMCYAMLFKNVLNLLCYFHKLKE